jgi:putative ABC transport system permease protein
MQPILLTPRDLAVSSSLFVLDGVLSLVLGLGLHRQLLVAATRMVIQLLVVGLVLRSAFALASPALTLGLVLVMVAIAAREVAVRPEQRLVQLGNYAIAGVSVALATAITAILALTTAIRPHPWYDPHYAIPLAGIITGNVLNAASLALDSLLSGVVRERPAIEAQLALGATIRQALSRLIRQSIRRALLPMINTMSAAGVVTLPGIMTGQILAGLDPVQAVKYQILLMFLLSGGGGLGAAAAVFLGARRLTDSRQRLRLDRLAGTRRASATVRR